MAHQLLRLYVQVYYLHINDDGQQFRQTQVCNTG